MVGSNWIAHVTRRRSVVLMIVAVVTGLILAVPGVLAALSAAFAGDGDRLRDAILGFGAFAPVASVLLNIAQGVVAPIPGFVIPYINGVVFGTVNGALLSWVGGVGAATACFAIARTVGARFAERLCRAHTTLDRANEMIARHGLGAVIVARLLPGMPFDAFSYLGGLSRVRPTQFILGTAIGSAPHALAYAAMGEHLAVPLWIGLVLTPTLGLMVALVHRLVRGVRRRALAAPLSA